MVGAVGAGRGRRGKTTQELRRAAGARSAGAGASSAGGGGPVPAPRSWARDLPASGTARAAAGLDGVLGAALLGAAAWIWVCLSVGAEICRS